MSLANASLSGFVCTAGSLDKKLNYAGCYHNRVLRTYSLCLFFLGLSFLTHPANFSRWRFLQTVLLMPNYPTVFKGGLFTPVFWSMTCLGRASGCCWGVSTNS